MSPDEIEAMRQSIPERTFQQEIAAEFVDGEGSVFRNIAACVRPPRPASGQIVVGVDWGMRADFTALVAMDQTRHVVDFCKFRQVRYDTLVDRAVEFAIRNRAWGVLAETNSIGDPLFEQLHDRLADHSIRVAPFITTNATKTKAIERLAFAIERNYVSWPEAYADLTNELEIYEFAQTATGKTSYSAPVGQHDDAVIALALANAAAEELAIRGNQKAIGVRVDRVAGNVHDAIDHFARHAPS